VSLFDNDNYLPRVVLIPSAVFLSAIFGGAYGSGREVVEFMTRYGPIGGLLSIVAIALAFAGCLFLCFEIARLTHAYDYRSFGRTLLRGASPLYEAVLIIALLLALAINATASGTLIAGHFGYPPASAVGLFLLAVVVLTFFGRRIVEASMILAFAALIAILAVLAWIVATEHGDAVVASFAATSRGVDGIGAGLSVALATGGLIPLLLFCGRGLRTRREAGVAAICAGFSGVVPAVVFHLCFMLLYPQIIDAELPAYRLIADVAPVLVLNVYVLVLFWQMIQTGVAVLWGMLEALATMPLGRRLRLSSAWGRAAISASAVAVALVLTSIGLIGLIVQRNSLLFIAFLLVFWLPLLTRGLSILFRAPPKTAAALEAQA